MLYRARTDRMSSNPRYLHQQVRVIDACGVLSYVATYADRHRHMRGLLAVPSPRALAAQAEYGEVSPGVLRGLMDL